MALGLHDVEKLQALYPNHRIELSGGKLILMNPADCVTGEIGAQFSTLLGTWVYTHNLGRVLDASAGLLMPNGDLLSPNVSFVSREQLKQTSRTYLSVVPRFVVEIKSCWDRIHELEGKVALFLSQGVQVGLLIDPDRHTVSICRSDGLSKDADSLEFIPQKTTLRDGDILTVPELFPGWEIPITSLWPAVYE